MLRKFAASLLVLLFVAWSIPNFFIYSFSKTYLDTNFYQKDKFVDGVYTFAVDRTVELLRQDSDLFKGYFDSNELRTQIQKVLTRQIFVNTISDFAKQIDAYKLDQTKPLVLSLRQFRENLVTVSHNLTYLIYQNLPTCSDDDLAKALRNNSVPECVPPNAPYDQVVKPINDSFEASIYNEIPEELSNFDKAVPLDLLVNVEKYRNASFLVLVVIMALIVLVVYGKTSTILAYLSAGFILGGGIGYLFAMGILQILNSSNVKFSDEDVKKFVELLFTFVTSEVQKLALIFVVVGIALLLMRLVFKRTVEVEKLQN